MLGLLALLELVDGLAVAGGVGEGLAAGVDLVVAAGELKRGPAVVALGALHLGLDGQEVGAASPPPPARSGSALARGGRDLGRLLEQRLPSSR